MGTITVNVRDETINRFRKTVAMNLGIGKGKLGKAIDEALNKWVYEKQQEEIAARQKRMMAKGFKLGKIEKFQREDLYDRVF